MTKRFHMELDGIDAKIMVEIVNQVIDARLTAVSHSNFEWRYHLTSGKTISVAEAAERPDGDYPSIIAANLHCDIGEDDYEVILRRLVELYEDDETSEEVANEAYSLEDALLFYWYAYDGLEQEFIPIGGWWSGGLQREE